MSRRRSFGAVALAALVSLVFAVPALAAGPPPPKAANGNEVEVAGTGVPTPTAFAFTGTTVFAASGPSEKGGPGGLFTLADGKATKVPKTPPVIFGLAWYEDQLYVSAGTSIVAYSGWNGTAFTGSKTIYSNKAKGFPGFNGLAFGPNGRLYAGLALNPKYDQAKDPFPLSQAVVSMTAAGKGLKVVARGMRQPWQLVFPEGSSNPYVTVLAQDKGKAPRDQIVVVKPGQNYGFPTCTWANAEVCKGYDRPKIFMPPHSSPMGIGSIGKTLYVSLFNGTGKGPEVTTVSTKGGKAKPFLTGFVAPVVGLGVDAGNVYVGDLTGTIYKVAAK
jgi:glucose/arabinose dehydrogenase